MHFSSKDISPAIAYKLLTSTVLPRPIAFVTSINQEGQLNAAPFSFFNAMGSQPPVVVLGFEPNTDGSQKDTPNNILATKEFVVNMVNEELSVQMNMCAASLASDVDELSHADIETVSSLEVVPPRILASPVSMECKLLNSMPLQGGGLIIVGEILHLHLRDDIVTGLEPLRIDINKLAPISRLNGSLYGRVTDQFTIKRPE